MKIELEVYKKEFGLYEAEFTQINHGDNIIAEVYKVVRSDKKQFILKVCPYSGDYFREVYFLRQLKNCISVPKLLATLDPSDSYCGALLMEYLEGDLLKEEDWSNDLAFEIGKALASLHNNQTDGYGDLTKPKMLVQKSDRYFNDKFEEELDECKGHLSDAFIKKCALYLNSYQGLLAEVNGPCIVHRDFRPGNLIVLNGKLQGIIDWASSRSGFAEQDLCSIDPWITDLSYKKSFLDGYSSIRPVPNYQSIMPLLQLGRSLAVIGYLVKSNTWNTTNVELYRVNRGFLDSFNFFIKL